MAFTRPRSASSKSALSAYFKTMAGRRLIRQIGVVAGAFLLGYLVTVFWLFPAPLFRSDHAVPRVLDLGVTAAREKLEAQGFRFHIEDQHTDPTASKGAVIWQDPPPGVVVEPNSQVSLTLSEGPPEVSIPDVGGFPRALAEKVLRAAGFTVGKPDTLPASYEAGVVVGTRPGPGLGRPAGSPVNLVISSGPTEFSVPGVLGLPLVDARSRIESQGLTVGSVAGRVVPGRPEGVVVQQRPPAGTRAAAGTRVDLVVTKKGS
jgi:eukaryotic-like serine/threonine-protein kinase